MGMLLVIDSIGGEACRDVQQCAWGRGYLRAADGSSFCTLADGVVGQMIRCTNNGRYFYTALCGQHRHAHRLSNPRGYQAGRRTSRAPYVAIAPKAENPENSLTSNPCTTE